MYVASRAGVLPVREAPPLPALPEWEESWPDLCRPAVSVSVSAEALTIAAGALLLLLALRAFSRPAPVQLRADPAR